jgi:hypothetical protein
MPTTVEKLPNFEFDIFIDGVQIFKNAEKPTLTPILGGVHSISHCYDSSVPLERSITHSHVSLDFSKERVNPTSRNS